MGDDVEHFLTFTGEAAIQVCCLFSNWIVGFLTVKFREFFSGFVICKHYQCSLFKNHKFLTILHFNFDLLFDPTFFKEC